MGTGDYENFSEASFVPVASSHRKKKFGILGFQSMDLRSASHSVPVAYADFRCHDPSGVFSARVQKKTGLFKLHCYRDVCLYGTAHDRSGVSVYAGRDVCRDNKSVLTVNCRDHIRIVPLNIS